MHISKLPRHDVLPAQYIVNDHPEEDPQRAADTRLSQAILDKLLAHYPGHPWWVQVPPKQGVAIIKHCMLSGLYGMVIHLRNLNGDPGMREVVRMGGEILERWGQKRAGLKLDEMVNAQPKFCDVKLIGRG